MKLINEQRRFARHYGLDMDTVRELWRKYSRKPANYRKVIEVDSNPKTVKGQPYGYLTGVYRFHAT
jgi:hypothetical protein